MGIITEIYPNGELKTNVRKNWTGATAALIKDLEAGAAYWERPRWFVWVAEFCRTALTSQGHAIS